MANQYRSITAKGIESIFRVLIDADPRIARFRIGDYASSETMEDVYPMVILDFLGSRIERKATLHYKRWDIRLECYGMRRADGKNTTDVFAETDTILDDLVLRFVTEQDLIDMGFHFDARVSSNEYVIRNDRDDLIGVRTTISFNTPLMQCPDDFPVDALPDLGLYYSASTLTASSQYLTCLTLSGCSTIQSIQDDIAELYTLTGGTSSGAFLPLSGGTGGAYYFTGDTQADKVIVGLGGLRLDYVIPNGAVYADQTGTLQTDPGNYSYDPLSSGLNVTALSASTIYSGATPLNNILSSLVGSPTYVQPGSNVSTGGTPSRPTVNVVASPSFSSLSATTIFSGGTDLSHLLTDRTTAGLNLYKSGNEIGLEGEIIITALTASRGTVLSTIVGENTGNGYGIEGVGTTQPGVYSLSYSGLGFYARTRSTEEDIANFYNLSFNGIRILNDGGLLWNSVTGAETTRNNLGIPFVQPGTNITTGGTLSATTINVVPSPVFTSVSATSVSATTYFSGSTPLSTILSSLGGTPTRVQPGTNITTGGTPSAPVINVTSSPVFTSVSATTISATTLVENGTSLASKYALTSIPELMTPLTGGTQTTTSVTLTDLSGSTMSLDASSWYEVEWSYIYTAAATTTGAFFSVNSNGTADYVSGVVYYDTGTGDGDSRVFNNFNQGIALASSRSATNNRGLIKMMVKTSSAINVFLRFATEVAGSAIGVTDISGYKLKKL